MTMEPEELAALVNRYRDAREREEEAASEAASLADELRDQGLEPEDFA